MYPKRYSNFYNIITSPSILLKYLEYLEKIISPDSLTEFKDLKLKKNTDWEGDI